MEAIVDIDGNGGSRNFGAFEFLLMILWRLTMVTIWRCNCYKELLMFKQLVVGRNQCRTNGILSSRRVVCQ